MCLLLKIPIIVWISLILICPLYQCKSICINASFLKTTFTYCDLVYMWHLILWMEEMCFLWKVGVLRCVVSSRNRTPEVVTLPWNQSGLAIFGHPAQTKIQAVGLIFLSASDLGFLWCTCYWIYFKRILCFFPTGMQFEKVISKENLKGFSVR